MRPPGAQATESAAGLKPATEPAFLGIAVSQIAAVWAVMSTGKMICCFKAHRKHENSATSWQGRSYSFRKSGNIHSLLLGVTH